MLNARAFAGLVCASWGVVSSLTGGVVWATEETDERSAPAPVDVEPAETAPVEAPSSPVAGDEPATSESAPPKAVTWRPLAARSPVPPNERPIFGSFQGTYLMIGPHLGVGLSTPGLLLGGEVSVVRQTTEFAWFGGYVDAVHDFARDQTRFSVGPEVGWSAFGLDAGYLLTSSSNGVFHGVTLRPLVSIGYVTLFGRLSKHVNVEGRLWGELGVLLKYPFEL